jgi:hypothetical protein
MPGQLIRYEEEDTFETGIPHIRNFIDCMRTRQKPAADVESQHVHHAVSPGERGRGADATSASMPRSRRSPATRSEPVPEAQYRDHWSVTVPQGLET